MRRWAVQMHLWLGLTLGLLWAVQGLTGAALVFHREFDRWAHPERSGSAGTMAALDELVAAARTASGAAPKRIAVVDGRPDIVMADYTDTRGATRQLFLDAATARVLDERRYDPMQPGDGATSRFLYNLHEKLLAGDTGETFVGVSGLVLMSSVGLGLWLGWPHRWRAVARTKAWRAWPQKLYGWHRLVGLAAGGALLAIAPTGVTMIFGKSLRAALTSVVPHEQPFAPNALAEPEPVRWIAAQAALDAARARFPEARFVRAALPSAQAPVYAIRLLQPAEVRAWAGTTTVSVDALTGQVLHVYDPLTAPLSNRIFDAAFAVHNGEIAGLLGRLLIMLAGLSLPVLYATGIWLWLAKRSRRAAAVSML